MNHHFSLVGSMEGSGGVDGKFLHIAACMFCFLSCLGRV